MRILLARAIQPDSRISTEAIVGRFELRMLPGEDDRRPQPARGKGRSDGCKLDRLGTSADDQTYATRQRSP
jgi:hypothetical protein